MKNIYKGYIQRSDEDFRSLWETAIFIFDTNVLLNLYRYQSSTRDALLNILDKLTDRIWIPYHVGLEFQRNRLKVISEQKQRFSEVIKAVEKSKSSLINDLENLQLRKRHSLINPDKLINGFESITKDFLKDLNELQKQQQGLTDIDPLREKIEQLFDGKVGSPPESQDLIEEIHDDGEYRVKYRIPPGYEDDHKDKGEPDEFYAGGLLYKRKYGDLVVWKQIIDYAKGENVKAIVFVTEDSKEDWWLKIKSDGQKIIGPRPELVDEIAREAGIDLFYMYSPEGFLKYSKEHLHTDVSEDAIKEVRDISRIRLEKSKDYRSLMALGLSAERAVLNWLENEYDSVSINRSFPDITAHKKDKKYGFEVKLLQEPRFTLRRIRYVINREYSNLKEGEFFEIALVMVCLDVDAMDDARERCMKIFDSMPDNFRVIIGLGETSKHGEIETFIPYESFGNMGS